MARRRSFIIVHTALVTALIGSAQAGFAEQGAAHTLHSRSQDREATGVPKAWDFNGDGFADLAIGAPGDRVRVDEAGAVNVLYGSETGPTANGNQLWSEASPGIAGRPEFGDFFGATLGSGDFDGDGFADLAVTTLSFRGAVHILYGSRTGLNARGSQLWEQTTPGLREPEGLGERFGFSLAASDFDGDGRDDLAIGIPNQPVQSLDSPGAVQVLYGSTAGLTTRGNQFWSRQTPGVKGQAKTVQLFGYALAAGDFDRDGADDLAVGAPLGLVGHDQGSVNVLYGGDGGLTQAGDQIWRQDTPGIKGLGEAGDRFGSALAAGNFGRGRADDLAVGIPGESVGALDRAGAVATLYGHSGALTASGDQLWTQDSPGIQDSAEIGDGFGSALAAGNFGVPGVGLDRSDDLAIGVPLEDSPTVSDVGVVEIIYGCCAGMRSIGLSSLGDQLWSQDAPGIADRAEAGDWFGADLLEADFGGAGHHSDLAIGVPAENAGSVHHGGAAHVLFGARLGLVGPQSQLWTQNSPFIMGRSQRGDRFGTLNQGGPFNQEG